MPTVISHGVFGAALGAALPERLRSRRVVAAGALGAMLPDADAIGFWLHVPYESTFGHRGFTHSFCFALLAGAALSAALARGERSRDRLPLLAYLSLAVASHPLYDMLTNGGLGVALFSPFSNERYFAPVRPIRVSPIGVHGLLSARGARLALSELAWVVLPAALFAGSVALGRRLGRGPAPDRRPARS